MWWQVLTLANGDRILMTPNMKAVFEPENLANASPATISRAGIIYVSDTELGWGPVVASWCQARPAAVTSILKPCFDKYVQPTLDYIRCEHMWRMLLDLAHAAGSIRSIRQGSNRDAPTTMHHHTRMTLNTCMQCFSIYTCYK